MLCYICVADEDLLEITPTYQKTKYKPEIADCQIKAVIREAMAERGVKEDDIPDEYQALNMVHALYPESKRYLEVQGFATFCCPNKHHRWPSPYSWCFIDLKNQVICHRDGQDCRKCETEVMPQFPRESLEKMAKQAVEKHLERTVKLYPQKYCAPKNPEESEHLHNVRRCGKCRREGSICWK